MRGPGRRPALPRRSDIHIIEDKSSSLIPRLASGWLDLVFVRPPEQVLQQFDKTAE